MVRAASMMKSSSVDQSRPTRPALSQRICARTFPEMRGPTQMRDMIDPFFVVSSVFRVWCHSDGIRWVAKCCFMSERWMGALCMVALWFGCGRCWAASCNGTLLLFILSFIFRFIFRFIFIFRFRFIFIFIFFSLFSVSSPFFSFLLFLFHLFYNFNLFFIYFYIYTFSSFFHSFFVIFFLLIHSS